MDWTLEFKPAAFKQIKKMDRPIQRRLFDFLDVLVLEKDPKKLAKPLVGNLGSLWRFRVGDYRVIAQIQDENHLILIAHLGHRKDIYQKSSHQ